MKKVHETEEVFCDQCSFLFFFNFWCKFHHVATKELGEWPYGNLAVGFGISTRI